jgi:hypothetical protein
MRRAATFAVLVTLALPGAAGATVPPIQAPQGPLAEGRWPGWDNIDESLNGGGKGIADCTFAAAADWEMIVLGKTPVEKQLIQEFHKAGGSDDDGLATTDELRLYATEWSFATYWRVHGINGVRVDLKEEPPSRLDVLIQIHKALFATGAGHAFVVAGFNSTGPEIVSYGETQQVTWADWRTWEVALYLPIVTRAAKRLRWWR